MIRWTDLKVKTKIVVLVSICCLSLVAVGALGLFNMKRLNSDLGRVDQSTQHVATMQEMKNHFLQMRLDLVYMMVLRDTAKLNEKWDDFNLQVKSVREGLNALDHASLDEMETNGLQEFRKGFEEYITQGTKLAEMARAAAQANDSRLHDETARFATGVVAPIYTRPAELISSLVEHNIRRSADEYQLDLTGFRKSFAITAGIVLLMAIGALLVGLMIANSISRPLQQVFEVLSRVAAGDLSRRLHIDSRDEMGLLATEVNQTADKLQEVISLVMGNSAQLSSASVELHATSAQMASGAEEMAAQAGTVATASEEMAATSSDIANNCHQAAGNAQHASEAAEAGSAVVAKTVAVMSRIADQVRTSSTTVAGLGQRSEQIGTIIGTIEDIADQTNLLALNAAIEAARAGEQGRGFAVVADEVRALAERTTKATREIGDMIKTIQVETRQAVAAMEQGVNEVENGTSEASRSGEALRRILDEISAVTMQVNQIATAAEEQTATTTEISNNIQQINQVVQHTAHGASESVIAANQLSSLAEQLQKLVGQFVLQGNGPSSDPAGQKAGARPLAPSLSFSAR